MKNKILKIMLIIFLLGSLLFTIIFFNFFDLQKDESGFHIITEENTKPFVKKVVSKITGKIYQEATEHNPEGDMLPDWIDDKIKEEIKRGVN